MERETFLALAVERLRQEIPDELDWLPWSRLPAMRWAADGASVDERIPRGWLVLAAERKSPEPDDEILRQAALFHPEDAADLAIWLLDRWIEHDTYVPELTAERRAQLRDIAEKAAEVAKRFGRGGSDPEERFQQLLRQEKNRPEPSALPDRGLLSVVAACADPRAATAVRSYLSAHHAERPEVCQVLLQMLSRVRASEASEVLAEAARLPELASMARELMAR